MKICASCQQELPFSDFHKRGEGYQSLCKPCRKTYDAAFWQRKRLEYLPKKYAKRKQTGKDFAAFKATLSCVLCGESHAECLDFHHKDPSTKDSTVADIAGKALSMKRIMREVEKCVVLCANCHRRVHAGSLTLPQETATIE